jgi:hypothetical protein
MSRYETNLFHGFQYFLTYKMKERKIKKNVYNLKSRRQCPKILAIGA